MEDARRQILAEVVAGVRSSPAPVPLEALADRALRALGHEKTIATGWAGAGSFRELLRRGLPDEIRLTDEPPYLAFDARRHVEAPVERRALDVREPRAEIPAPPASRFAPAQLTAEPAPHYPAVCANSTRRCAALRACRAAPPGRGASAATCAPCSARPARSTWRRQRPKRRCRMPARLPAQQLAPAHQAAQAPQRMEAAGGVQQSIARIQEACQAPPLAPPEYRLLFEIMAKEITDNDLIGAQTLTNITQRAQERGLDLRRDDVRFVLEVVSEADPWFEQGASANLFAGRFRNFVVARCRGQGLTLSADELDLIDAWFAGGTLPQSMSAPKAAAQKAAAAPAYQAPAVQAPQTAPPATEERAPQRWWSLDDGRSHTAEQRAGESKSERARAGRRVPAHRAHAAAGVRACHPGIRAANNPD